MNIPFTLIVTGLALITVAVLGHSDWTWPLITAGGWTIFAGIVLAHIADTIKERNHR